MAIHAYGGHEPKLSGSCFIAPSADLIGRVEVGEEASVWFGAVLRGDIEPIVIGPRSNVQDNCVLHTDEGFPLTIGAEVVVGHSVILHGCTIGDGVLVGMGAVVMNGVEIGAGSVIGAGALIPEGRKIPPRSLVIGMPGKVVRSLSAEEAAELTSGAASYARKAQRYRRELKTISG